ncbi:hypothetical protein Tco_0246673 [Tanacetum coccineum]
MRSRQEKKVGTSSVYDEGMRKRKRDTAYQRQVFTRKYVFIIPNTAYPPSAIRHQQIRRISQLDTTYRPFHLEQRIDFFSLNDCMTRSSTKELLSPFENPKQKCRSRRRLFDTPSLVESNSPEFDHNFDIEETSEEEVRETITETMEQYMRKTRGDYGSGVTRPTINQDTHFELKVQFLKELRDNTFSGSEHEDANKHIEKVLDIVYLFHILKVTQDQIMLRAFPVSLTRAASRWLRNQPSGSITTWEGAIPSKTTADAKIAIQEMAEYSQKWHNRTSSRTKSTKTSDRLATIKAQLNNIRQEIKKVNEKVYVAHVGWPGFYQQNNGNSSYPDRRPSLKELLTKFMAESAKRHEENSNIIKEIRATTDAAIRNQ